MAQSVRNWRWWIDQKDRWLIVTKIGVDMKRYPAIMKHLKKWQRQLVKRRDQGNHWWELRACAYYEAFEKPKIIFPDIAKEPRFAYDACEGYTNDTTFMICVDDPCLIAFLNSHPVLEYYQDITAQIRGGYLRYKKQYVSRIPIPEMRDSDCAAITVLVQKCLDAKGVGCEAWEREIDERVAGLYGL